jgi:hypothetical protein
MFFGILILQFHETCASFEGPSLDVISSLREEFAEVKQFFPMDAHEDYFLPWFIVLQLLLHFTTESLQYQV